MKNLALISRFAKIFIVNAVISLLLFASTLTVGGQTTTFAQFFERNGTQDFVFSNNGSSANFNAISGGSPVFFIYSNIIGLDPSLMGIQNAHMFVTTTTTQSGTLNAGTVTQPLNQTVIVQIIRDTPAPVGVGSGSRTNLLTAVFQPNTNTPAIVGSSGGNSATISATTPDHLVAFNSDFIGFGLTTQRNLGLSYSSVAPSLILGTGNFLQSFTAAGTGTFASNPPPVYGVPTASNSVVRGRVFASAGVGLRGAQVVLTESNGTVYNTTTSSFGHFEFPEIASGQTVIVSVVSKHYQFSGQVINILESVSEVNFFANEP